MCKTVLLTNHRQRRWSAVAVVVVVRRRSKRRRNRNKSRKKKEEEEEEVGNEQTIRFAKIESVHVSVQQTRTCKSTIMFFMRSLSKEEALV